MTNCNLKTDSKQIYLCEPRGFCAGVDRAVKIVELALEKYGAPVYVKHAIVHNKYVVSDLEKRGAVFVEKLSEIPINCNAPIVFSAHGVSLSVKDAAQKAKFDVLDATCPLVSKVHSQAKNLYNNQYFIFLIGHEGHPEVVGTLGQVPPASIQLIETVHDIEKINNNLYKKTAYLTQTTLSVDDTTHIIAALKDKFPDIKESGKDDICYATTNRQSAVKKIAKNVDAFIVVGSQNSSNSQRLCEVAKEAGCNKTYLIDKVSELDWSQLVNIKKIGLSAGASAPEILVEEVISEFKRRFVINVTTLVSAKENMIFKVPKKLLNST